MYQALYRKYRPQRFSDVIGQDHITNTLRRQVASGHTSHAYLFVGSRGTGKTTCAKILAKALNCEHPVDGEPCNECAACMGISSGAVLDVAEIDAASNNGVDNVRAIREEAVFSPASVKKRVYIIDEVHMLSTSAFNALLKILEEPPEHLVFILATTELNKVPATILSRCQRFSFKRLMPEDIEGRLRYVARAEGIDITDGAVSLLARLADGAMRDALSLLDQCITGGRVDENTILSAVGLAGSADTARLWGAAASGDTNTAVSVFEKLYLGGADPASIINSVVSLMRDMMIVRIAPDGSAALVAGAFGRRELSEMSENIGTGTLLAASEALQEAVSRMSAVRDRRTAAEIAIIRLAVMLFGEYSGPAPEAQPSKREKKSGKKPLADASAQAPRRPQPDAAGDGVLPPPARQNVREPAHDEPAEERPPLPDTPPWEDYPSGESAPGNNAPEERAPVPEAPPERKEPPSGEKPQSGSFWDEVLRRVKPVLDPGTYAILSDRHNVAGRAEGSNVIVAVYNPVFLGILDTAGAKNAVASAAAAVLGRNVAVRVQIEDRQAELKEDKLEALSKFKNVNFT